MVARLLITLRRLLEELHVLKGRVTEEEHLISETRTDFDRKLTRMEREAEEKRRRVRALELQVEAIQRRRRRPQSK